MPGDQVDFVALADGRLVEEVGAADLEALAPALAARSPAVPGVGGRDTRSGPSVARRSTSCSSTPIPTATTSS